MDGRTDGRRRGDNATRANIDLRRQGPKYRENSPPLLQPGLCPHWLVSLSVCSCHAAAKIHGHARVNSQFIITRRGAPPAHICASAMNGAVVHSILAALTHKAITVTPKTSHEMLVNVTETSPVKFSRNLVADILCEFKCIYKFPRDSLANIDVIGVKLNSRSRPIRNNP